MPGITLRRIKDGQKTGSPLKLDGSRFLFGRSKECDVRLSSDAASRRHAVVRLEGSTWYAEDMGSQNGTYLNGKKIQMGALRPSDVLKFGESEAKIQIVALDPPPGRDADGEEETRVLEISRGGSEAVGREAPAKPKKQKKQKKQKPPKRKESAPPPQMYQEPRPPRRGAPAWTWLLTLIFLGIGGALAWNLMKDVKFLQPFPIQEVFGPLRWVWEGIGKLKLDLDIEAAKWVLRGTIILYFGLFGFFIRRPWKYRFFLLVILVAHGISIATLTD